MKTVRNLIPILFLSLLVISCSSGNKVELFNGENLDNWNVFVSEPDVDPEKVFWVADGLINTTGVPHAYIDTKESYGNFKLHVEWRWTEEPTNSGVLLHKQGKDMIWPLCIECQLQNGNAGDIVLIGKGSGITIKGTSHLITSEENRYEVIKKFEESSEHAAGEWNTYDITSQDGNIEVIVNGVLQNTGTDMTLTSGKIALQSEGSPMQFRNIHLEVIE